MRAAAKAKPPFTEIVRLSPPLFCSATVPLRPEVVPPMAKLEAGPVPPPPSPRPLQAESASSALATKNEIQTTRLALMCMVHPAVRTGFETPHAALPFSGAEAEQK